MEGIVECKICGFKGKALGSHFYHKHKLLQGQYGKMFPGSVLVVKGLNKPRSSSDKRFSEEFGNRIRIRMLKNNPMSVKEYRDKVGQSKKGCIPWDKDVKIDREKYPKMGHFQKHTDVSKRKMSEHHWSKRYPERYEKEIIRGVLLKVGKHPNELEKKCFSLLEKLNPGEFEYCGSGQFLINGKSPDFKSKYRKVVVLCNGVWWHLGKFGLKVNEENKRVIEFNESRPFVDAGYEVWFYWEDNVDERSVVMV